MHERLHLSRRAIADRGFEVMADIGEVGVARCLQVRSFELAEEFVSVNPEAGGAFAERVHPGSARLF
ncbi:MAG: hypothetical protein WAL35_03880 [Acidimicrobiales bacterium]